MLCFTIGRSCYTSQLFILSVEWSIMNAEIPDFLSASPDGMSLCISAEEQRHRLYMKGITLVFLQNWKMCSGVKG